MKGLRTIAILLAAAFFCAGCDGIWGNRDKVKKLDKVLILYMAGFNSLSPELQGDITELRQGALPAKGDNCAILIVNHYPTERLQYGTKTRPSILRLYKDKKGQPVLDTLTRLGEDELLTKKEIMARSLDYIASTFKSDHYGLILASHGTGWLPAGYYATPYNYKLATAGGKRSAAKAVFPTGAVPYVEPEPMPGPKVRTFGEEIYYEGSSKLSYEMDLRDLPAALPFHFDYILMDACLMGCVEVAYELKDKCDLLGFSPTEILSDGLVYTKIASRLLKSGDPDIKGVMDDYYDCYAAQSGDYQSACFTLVDCKKLDALAQACRSVFETYREAIGKVNPSSVQPMFRSYHHWFYDLKDILDKSGAEASSVQSALNQCVTYKVHTKAFMPSSGGFVFNAYCGLSMYLPCNGSDYLDEYYKTLAWNKATSLVR